MKISVVIATKDRPKELNTCLESIQKQNYSDFEVIIVDDGSSTNNSIFYKKIINDAKISTAEIYYYRNSNNKGRSFSRNLGIKKSKGEIVAFIDDDAVPKNNWLYELVNILENNDISGVGGKIIPFPNQNFYFIPPTYNKSDKVVPVKNIIQEGNCAFKKNALEDVNGFDPKITFAHEGKDLSIRLNKNGYKLFYTPKAIIFHSPSNPNKINKFLKRAYIFGISDAYINKKYHQGIWRLLFNFNSIKLLFDFYFIFIILLPIISISLLSINSYFLLMLIIILFLLTTLGMLITFSSIFKTKNIKISGVIILSRLAEKIGNIVGYTK
jgi:O-antigen biosynthesis protein